MQLNEVTVPTRWSGHVGRHEVEVQVSLEDQSISAELFATSFNENYSDRYSDEEIDNQQLDCDINIAWIWYSTGKWPDEPCKWWQVAH